SSSSIRCRLERICSTTCCSNRYSSSSTATFDGSFRPLMRHRVRHNVDSHRIRPLLGKSLEVLDAFSFPLPAVAEIGVVANNRHQATLVVEQAAVVDLAGRRVPGAVGRVAAPVRSEEHTLNSSH